jgi:hypothetical protein
MGPILAEQAQLEHELSLSLPAGRGKVHFNVSASITIPLKTGLLACMGRRFEPEVIHGLSGSAMKREAGIASTAHFRNYWSPGAGTISASLEPIRKPIDRPNKKGNP